MNAAQDVPIGDMLGLFSKFLGLMLYCVEFYFNKVKSPIVDGLYWIELEIPWRALPGTKMPSTIIMGYCIIHQRFLLC